MKEIVTSPKNSEMKKMPKKDDFSEIMRQMEILKKKIDEKSKIRVDDPKDISSN